MCDEGGRLVTDGDGGWRRHEHVLHFRSPPKLLTLSVDDLDFAPRFQPNRLLSSSCCCCCCCSVDLISSIPSVSNAATDDAGRIATLGMEAVPSAAPVGGVDTERGWSCRSGERLGTGGSADVSRRWPSETRRVRVSGDLSRDGCARPAQSSVDSKLVERVSTCTCVSGVGGGAYPSLPRMPPSFFHSRSDELFERDVLTELTVWADGLREWVPFIPFSGVGSSSVRSGRGG